VRALRASFVQCGTSETPQIGNCGCVRQAIFSTMNGGDIRGMQSLGRVGGACFPHHFSPWVVRCSPRFFPRCMVCLTKVFSLHPPTINTGRSSGRCLFFLTHPPTMLHKKQAERPADVVPGRPLGFLLDESSMDGYKLFP
jgi:hypothetical protein